MLQPERFVSTNRRKLQTCLCPCKLVKTNMLAYIKCYCPKDLSTQTGENYKHVC